MGKMGVGLNFLDLRPISLLMNERHGLVSKRWLILILLALTAPLFQNMSWMDIRDSAPAKPQGYLQDRDVQYIPVGLHANSLGDVEQGFLSHNFDPWFQQFETRYLRPSTPYFGLSLLQKEDVAHGELAALVSDQALSSVTGRWRLAMVNPRKVRLSLQKKWSGRDFEMVCESDQGDGLRFGMSRLLTSQMGLSFFHQSGTHKSQLQMSYQF